MKQICSRCNKPRKQYDLKHEPSYANPDWTLGICALGHNWVFVDKETGEINWLKEGGLK